MTTIEKSTISTTQSIFHIEPLIPYAMHSPVMAKHIEYCAKLLQYCVQDRIADLNSLARYPKSLDAHLPIITWDIAKYAPGSVACAVLCPSAKEDGLENKIASILRYWLIPGKNTQLFMQTSLYFRWKLFPDTSFFVMEAKALIENKKDLDHIHISLPSFTSQLHAALKSPITLKNFFSQRSLLQDTKQAQTHQELITLIERFPHFFSPELFLDMGRFFALCDRSFFEPRPARLITKIVSFHHLMRINLSRLTALYPEKRHIQLRCIRSELNFYFGSKPILGLVLAVSPLDNHEFCEEEHIAQAIAALLPDASTIKNSFYSHQRQNDPICTLYVELEKKDGSTFTTHDICILKTSLTEELKRRIEKLVPSIFMARNEEEVMRNILLLSQELRYLSDIPQVIISLDTQTLSDIFFTVILVRLMKPNQNSIADCFANMSHTAEFIADRVQQVGFLRKSHPKEANVFHLKIPKNPSFLRADSSVNFYSARAKVSSILQEAVGPFRDYNGGMILKQGELFCQLQDSFPTIEQKNPEILENFFFSLSPIEAQATLSLSALQILFSQFLKAQHAELHQQEDYFLYIEEKNNLCFATLRIQDLSFKQELLSALHDKEFMSKSLIHTSINMHGSLYIGMIFHPTDERRLSQFLEILHITVKNKIYQIQNQQVLKLCFATLPQALDPRFAGERGAHIVIKMLFEGLTRLDKNGKPSPALAKHIDISPDCKKYTFTLRQSQWSNGAPITAHDFVYSWQKILSPQFYTPFTYVFYPIKNAKEAKAGLCPMQDIGVHAINDETLVVDLEYPTPEFLELTAHSLYSPVHHITDKIHPNWSSRGSKDFVCNGPFILKDTFNHMRYEFVKNPLYWDKEHVHLQKVRLAKNSTFIANEMFHKEEAHWLGSPMGPWEFFLDHNKGPRVHSAYIGIYWCVFNTEKFPFHNKKLRQAFNLAINKCDLTSKIDADHMPATTPLPLSHTMNHDPSRLMDNELQALELFEIALQELGLTRKTFPLITLNFLDTPLRKKTLSYLRERWKSLFQIPCRLEGFDMSSLFSKITKGDFHISGLYWKTWIDDPSYLLDVFAHPHSDINVAKWENASYTQHLHQARNTLDPVKKVKHLSDAEKILIEEVPIMPIFYEKEKNITKPYLHNVIHSKTTGHIDFKYAYINKQNSSTT